MNMSEKSVGRNDEGEGGTGGSAFRVGLRRFSQPTHERNFESTRLHSREWGTGRAANGAHSPSESLRAELRVTESYVCVCLCNTMLCCVCVNA